MRVVVTGIGALTPLGCNADSTWSNLLAGKSGIRRIDRFDVSDLLVKIAGLLPENFNPDEYLEPKEQKKFDKFVTYAVAAATQAVNDAGWQGISNAAVIIGAGIGGLERLYNTSIDLANYGPRGISPFFIPGVIGNMAAGMVAIKLGFHGANFCTTSACSSGAHAIAEAFRRIQNGEYTYALAGGAEGVICRLGIAGFTAAKALSTKYNDKPESASRPWDKNRDGFVMGEGAGVLALEALDSAIARGAHIYGEILAASETCDAYHITAPDPTGASIYSCMYRALTEAKLDNVDYINAHGTSTPMGDSIELKAVEALMADLNTKTIMSSTKSATGHLLGAAGAIEGIISLLALKHQVLPGTLNLDNPEETQNVNLIKSSTPKIINTVMSNSFGFGGTNVSLVFGKI